MANYKTPFQDVENHIFNTVESEGKRFKLMSVYSYIKKYSPNGTLTYSVNKLFKMYTSKTKRVSLSWFKDLVKMLVDLKLIVVEKVGRLCSYSLAPLPSSTATKTAIKTATEEVPEPVEITSVEVDTVFPKYKIVNNTYTNTPNTDSQSVLFEVVPPIELVNIANNLFKEFRIKSKIVKSKVIGKLRNCSSIHRAGAIAYVTTVVLEKCAINQQKRNDYFRTRNMANVVATTNSFTNYTQNRGSYYENNAELLRLASIGL